MLINWHLLLLIKMKINYIIEKDVVKKLFMMNCLKKLMSLILVILLTKQIIIKDIHPEIERILEISEIRDNENKSTNITKLTATGSFTVIENKIPNASALFKK